MIVPIITLFNNWKTEKQFIFIDVSFNEMGEKPLKTFSFCFGLMGLGVVLTWLD